MTRWEGYDVKLDGTAVRFGAGEHDWVRPYADSGAPRLVPLRSASVSKDGKLLTVRADDHDFIFYAAQEDPKYGGTVFHYRIRAHPPTRSFQRLWQAVLRRAA